MRDLGERIQYFVTKGITLLHQRGQKDGDAKTLLFTLPYGKVFKPEQNRDGTN